MHPKDADRMANSVDPDQTASSEAVWSWSALFAETYLSQYIEFVRYILFQSFQIGGYIQDTQNILIDLGSCSISSFYNPLEPFWYSSVFESTILLKLQYYSIFFSVYHDQLTSGSLMRLDQGHWLFIMTSSHQGHWWGLIGVTDCLSWPAYIRVTDEAWSGSLIVYHDQLTSGSLMRLDRGNWLFIMTSSHQGHWWSLIRVTDETSFLLLNSCNLESVAHVPVFECNLFSWRNT